MACGCNKKKDRSKLIKKVKSSKSTKSMPLVTIRKRTTRKKK